MSYAAELLVSFVVAYVAVRLLDPVARRWGLLDHPRGRKDHALPTPVTGGPAVMLGILATLPLMAPMSRTVLAFCLGALLLLLVGIIDDRRDLPWKPRVLAQCAAALVMVYVGDVRILHIGPLFGHESLEVGWLSVPFTVFVTVGIINAIKMADGSDGLAGTLVLVALAMLAAVCVVAGNDVVFRRILPLIGAVTGFLALNMRHPWQPRARAFLGNSGSAVLGFFIAWLTVRVSHFPGHPVSSILLPWLVALPLIDCLVLMTRRVREGRSPFSADRNHMHHLMLDAGFTPTQAALLLGTVSLAFGAMAATALRAQVPPMLLVVAFVALIGVHYRMTANREWAVALLRRMRRMPAMPQREVLALPLEPSTAVEPGHQARNAA
jgi:UDP-GlcNAc:undecaprenyl-phosphate GlcNAc-1-phosphate transferase